LQHDLLVWRVFLLVLRQLAIDLRIKLLEALLKAQRRAHAVEHLGEHALAPGLLLALDPDAQRLGDLPHVEPVVDRLAQLGQSIADRAARVLDLAGIVLVAAALALVAVGIRVLAARVGAGAAHEAVRQEPLHLRIVPLPARALVEHAVIVQLADEILALSHVDRKALRA
jgi:hypothetical protein